MSPATLNSQRLRLFLALLLFITLLGALLMSATALRTSTRFDDFYSWLLVLTSSGLLVLVILLVLNLRQLIHQVRMRHAGAQLTVRLVVLFALLSLTPVAIVYYFSLEFLHQRVDSWFDPNIEQTLQDSMELSRVALDGQLREAMRQATGMVAGLDPDPEVAGMQLDAVRARTGAVEVSLMAANGRIIAFSSTDIGQLLPTRPPKSVLLKLNPQSRAPQSSAFAPTLGMGKQSAGDEDNHIALEDLDERGLFVRTILPCALPPDGHSVSERCLLHALFPVPARISELVAQVDKTASDYKKMGYMRKPLKISFTLILSLVFLLTVFSAVWLAFFSARRLVAPIRDLAEGTRAVAAGNYDTRLPVKTLDELGFLVQSFNDMTYKIRLAQDDVQRSRQIADTQRAYLEVVLERLSSGVLALDHKHRLRTGNTAAEQILGIEVSPLRGQHFSRLCDHNEVLRPLCDTIESHLHQDTPEWQAQITLLATSGRKILMCRGKHLPPPYEGVEVPRYAGYVIVFDDITALIQAQRTAAWSEVAQRLAHEIKNPLTPIQLSAERLRHKYLPSFPDKEADVLDRMTHTIIQQVEALKEMVNNFNNYARPPQLKPVPLHLNTLIREVLDLYHFPNAHIHTRLAADLPMLSADTGRLRQVLHNLLKNALEANPGGEVWITTYREQGCVVWEVADNGPGIDEALLDDVFQPYTTSKPKGSGLGLAIVKRIMEEHGGMIQVKNREGACVIMHLPVKP